jgi:ABC-type multidrug transport system permease subunit
MLILSIILVILFLIKQYIFEMFLMRRLYKAKYTALNEVERRGFINHHIAGMTKALILVVAVYPFIDVAFRTATLQTKYAKGSVVTLGDILVVSAQMLVGMYIFELIYRVKISPISTLHHIGTILVAQSAIAISLNLDHEPDATVEFILCTVWGE